MLCSCQPPYKGDVNTRKAKLGVDFPSFFRFDSPTTVDRLNLTVPRGVIFGFLGPNGAGKSTTINMLTSLLPPTAGTATVGGFDIQAEPLEAKRCIGVMPEGLGLYKRLTAAEQIEMMGRRGTTVFFFTHVMELAERFCDQVGIINRGRLASPGSIAELHERAVFPMAPRWRTCSYAPSARR